jgi:hypothetical protein
MRVKITMFQPGAVPLLAPRGSAELPTLDMAGAPVSEPTRMPMEPCLDSMMW